MWPFSRPEAKPDRRGGRLVFLVECLMNQNARDLGAAERPAVDREVLEILADAHVGMVQIPCPEMVCLGFERRRAPGQRIRQALEEPAAMACCNQLAMTAAERIEAFSRQGYRVLAVLGGNAQSPACAVHTAAGEVSRLTEESGVFMQLLASELAERGLSVPFLRIRDAQPRLLAEDLARLRCCVTDT
jgi:predicted secreted protein